MATLQNLLNLAANAVEANVHGLPRYGVALLVLGTGFLAAELGARIIALMVRVVLITLGVLVAARIAGII